MSKKKLLYVAPHLSTGGQPQYLYKQVKEFIKDFEIEVVEINNSGGTAFVVQKNRIKSLVPIHTLAEDKSRILQIIEDFKPDIIHFQEIPQFDLPPFALDVIFRKDRPYFIVASTHGSLTNPSEIVYHPDRYILVSEWSRQRFIETGVETDVWQYPIEDYVFVGAGSVIIPNVTIPNHCLVGAGSVVLKSPKTKEKIVGVPAKSIKHSK